MNQLSLILILLCFSQSVLSLTLDEKIATAKKRCTPHSLNEPHFFMDMFKQSASIEEIDALYTQTYNQQERLYSRAGYDNAKDSFVSSNGSISVSLPDAFLRSIILHIETALKLKYVKYIFFPDMGHSHLLIPDAYYDEHFKGKYLGPSPNALNEILKTPGLKSLYHTAEHFKFKEQGELLPDNYVQWRYYTRNPVFDANGNVELHTKLSAPANAVSSVPGYHWYSGISLSAHKNGCFPFENASGQVQYFDISAWDPPYDCVNNFCG